MAEGQRCCSISRAPGANLNRLVQFPPVPGLAIRQGSITHVVRLAEEPNTQNSSLVPGSFISGSVTLVLEHFFRVESDNGGALKPGGGSQGISDPYIDFNQALDVTIPAAPDIGLSPIPPPLSIPAYDPSQYPTASGPLPVTGYNAGSYFDPAHPGEGMLVGVKGDLVGDFQQPLRAITLAWLTPTTRADGRSGFTATRSLVPPRGRYRFRWGTTPMEDSPALPPRAASRGAR